MSNYPPGMTNHDFELFEGDPETHRKCETCQKVTDHWITGEERRSWGLWVSYECQECGTNHEYSDVYQGD